MKIILKRIKMFQFFLTSGKPEIQKNDWPFVFSMAKRQRIGLLDTWPCSWKQIPSFRIPIVSNLKRNQQFFCFFVQISSAISFDHVDFFVLIWWFLIIIRHLKPKGQRHYQAQERELICTKPPQNTFQTERVFSLVINQFERF